MKHKKELVVLSLIAITIIGILSGASYAYFQVQQKQGQETVIESGTMALTLEDGATITADNLIPGEYIEKEFTVKNTGTLKTGYDIYLSEVVNTFVNQSDLVYEIISSNGYNTSNQIQVPNTETKIINNYNINPLEEHKYILKITYKLTNENQNDNMGRTFIAKININEYNQNNSERYIKLYDANNNEIDKQVLTNNSDYYYPLSNINLSNSTNIYCNNGGIPTIENNTLKVSEVTTATDCKISNSINTTISNLPNTKTGIVMTNSQDNVARMTISSGKEVVLDLNGKEINSIGIGDNSNGTYNENYEVFRITSAKLTVNDSVGTGGMYTGTTARVFFPLSNSQLIINNGNYNGRQSIVVNGIDNYLEINNGNFTSNLYATLGLNECINNCRIVINNGNFNQITNHSMIIDSNESNNLNMTINNGIFTSTGKIIDNNSGTININGGIFISYLQNAIYNSGTGNVNINQTTTPIYLSSLAKAWRPVIYNNTGNIINIKASKANKCTNNYQDTTSGLCVYAEGNGIYTTNEANLAVTNQSGKAIYINGGTYYGGRNSICNNEDKKIYIMNADLLSGNLSLINNEGEIYLCNSRLNKPIYQYDNSTAKIYYSNDVVFFNGTNTPNNVYGSYESGYECPSEWVVEY